MFSSPVLETGESYEFTFNEAGTYLYWCRVHPPRVGTITVGP